MINDDDFLRELTELSHKHGVYIWGCGCCGSPSIEEIKGSAGHYLLSTEKSKYRSEAIYWVVEETPEGWVK